MQQGGKRVTKETLLAESSIDLEKLSSNRILERVLHSAAAKILDFFIIFREYDYSEVDIARKTGLSAKTVSKELDNLIAEKYIKITRKSGKSSMYKLDESEYTSGLLTHYMNIMNLTKSNLKS